ncbi:MAG: type I glyceraldehyde-3-phosphate dehydrogenase [Candidatus Curtissbacteria bacterium]|nr:type I glyceraldehyde-3-phosphate dehydrogenase [Candidatus Curtissbacteria bacterium]
MVRVAINGFGRIGRSAFKVWFEKHRDEMEIVAVNDLTDAKTLAQLLKYDSNYGIWEHEVEGTNVTEGSDDPEGEKVGVIKVDGVEIATYATKEPAKLPWGELGIDVVIESTGRFTDEEGMRGHLTAGAKKVVLSAPAKGGNVGTFLLGVNEDEYKGEELINNGSCTTNSIAPVAKIMEEKFGVKKAMMTTVHAYTADQQLQDGPHKDLRRARAAAENIVPTTTGAAISTGEVIPKLKGEFDGVAIRVPVAVGSISDFTFLLEKEVTVDEVNKAFEEAAGDPRYKGILAVTREQIVSSDIVGRSESSIVDLSLTKVVGGDMVKVFAWYDNEFGYANRLIEQVIQVGTH